ncbi:uncharacterized protein LOC129249183 [Anastrepha obliqua]|uniref:uncharacterized protein LOC129249183 n=1 Tax=Anastrepha obliqua TaxID=95512 RepID=UPI00240A1788|nr:uncharacterized protein LOC129249183 [Anastrepha obliqua]XP_054744825.1 uncharacterized protein LOC129249183 [Anastrepha obliqua]
MPYAGRRPSADRMCDSEYITPRKKGPQKSMRLGHENAGIVKLYPRHEIMFSKEPEFEHFAIRKELNDFAIARDRSSLKSGSTNSLESRVDRLSTRMKAGANNPAERRVPNVVMSPSECKSKPLGLHHLNPKTKVNVIEVKLSQSSTKSGSPVDCFTYGKFFEEEKKKPFKTRGTQSLYRESSAQTLPFLPDVSNKQDELEQIELFKLPTILPGDGPPGLYQVEVLERMRKRWAFAQALKENLRRQIEEVKEKAKTPEHSIILQAFEWEHWIEREEYIQECQMLRLEILIGMFNKREEEMHAKSKTRIEQSYEQILARRDASLHKNQVEYDREMRQLEIKRRRVPKCWRKENILSQLGSPNSEFYGPQLRYGVNPSRRHFVGGRKEFEARMDDLEKRAVKFTKLVCPFAKLKKWATPKQRFLEIEQNFCSDENLQKMYETLSTLRKQAVKQKIMPKCLIQKTQQIQIKSDTINRLEEEKILEESEEIQEITEQIPSADDLKHPEYAEFRKSIEINKQHAQQLLQELYKEELEAMIHEYEGCTIGWLMRFLSEELGRMQEQRLLQYVVMLAQKERWRREAAEAGLRQKENEMRQIYEQIYTDSYMASADICRKYLNMILENDIPGIAHDKAEAEVVDMARVIDTDIQRWLDSLYVIQNPLNYDSLHYKLKKAIFPDLNDILKEIETKETIDYIIDMLFTNIFTLLEPYDICTFTANEIVDRLLDLDLYYFSSEENSTCSCTACECPEEDREVRALVRKLIRQVVPGRRWKTPVERLANEMVKDLVNNVIEETFQRGSIFESEHMNQFCQLRKSPSQLNLLSPRNPLNFVQSSSRSSSELEKVVSIVKSEYHVKHEVASPSYKSIDSFVSERLPIPEAFLFDFSDAGSGATGEDKEDVKNEDKLKARVVNHIYKELLNFLGPAEDNESVDEEELCTSRSVQSCSSDQCGLRLIIEEICNKISQLKDTNDDTGIVPLGGITETSATSSHIKTEYDLTEIHDTTTPLDLVTGRSSEEESGSSKQPSSMKRKSQQTAKTAQKIEFTEDASTEMDEKSVQIREIANIKSVLISEDDDQEEL